MAVNKSLARVSILPVILAIFLFLAAPFLLAQQSSVSLRLPDSWIPFSATLELRDVHGISAVGRFYRGSDGSTRAELGPSLDEVPTVTIRNMSHTSVWVWDAERGWTALPMDLGPWGTRPAPAARLSGYVLLETTIKDLEHLVMKKTETALQVLAPELNLLPLIMSHCPSPGGCHLRRYLDIEIGEQPMELFDVSGASPWPR